MRGEVQCASDYGRLVRVRALSRDIRRLLYCELPRCSGIHLDESALMTEVYSETGLIQITTALLLIKQTTSGDFSIICSTFFSLLWDPLVLAFQQPYLQNSVDLCVLCLQFSRVH